MIGVQSPFAPLSIPGKLAYLIRRKRLDDGWLHLAPPAARHQWRPRWVHLLALAGWRLAALHTKIHPPPDQQINTLWAVSTTGQPAAPVNLGISNIVHFADWQPGTQYKIAYSTVEPQAAAPGWDANNDLHILDFENGKPGKTTRCP